MMDLVLINPGKLLVKLKKDELHVSHILFSGELSVDGKFAAHTKSARVITPELVARLQSAWPIEGRKLTGEELERIKELVLEYSKTNKIPISGGIEFFDR